MKFKPEEFSAKTAEIMANLGDQAKVSTLLAELTEHNNETAADLTAATTTATKLTADNEKLRGANLELFLKVGTTKTDDGKKKEEPENTTPKFEDLFDEKGELK